MDLQVLGEHSIAREIRNQTEARCRDHDRHDSEAVQPIREIDRIAGTDDDKRAQDHKCPAEINHQLLEEWKYQRSRYWRTAEIDKRGASRDGNRRFHKQPRTPGKPGMRAVPMLDE